LDRKEKVVVVEEEEDGQDVILFKGATKHEKKKELWNECETFKLGVCVCAVLVRIPPELLDGGK
jgi:hypothetical protein